MTHRSGRGRPLLNPAQRASAWVIGACWLGLGCQAFSSPDDDRFVPSGPPGQPPFSSSTSGGQGPRSPLVPIPDRAAEAADAGEDSGLGTAPALDAALLDDAAVDASPAAVDAAAADGG